MAVALFGAGALRHTELRRLADLLARPRSVSDGGTYDGGGGYDGGGHDGGGSYDGGGHAGGGGGLGDAF